MADIDRAEAELVITLRVRAIDEGSAKSNISAVTAEIKRLQKELNKPARGQSFERVFISLFYLRQAIRTVTQSLQTFGAGNKMLQTQLNFMSQGIMNAVLGWKVMDKMLKDYINSLYKSIKLEKLRILQTKLARGEITQTMMEQEMSMLMQKQAAAAAVSGWVAIGFAVASIIPYLINLRKKSQEAAAQMLDDFANIRSTIDKFLESKTTIEALGALAQLSKKLGTEGAQNLLKFISAGGNIDEYLNDWKNMTKAQQDALWTLLSTLPQVQERLKKMREEFTAKDPIAAAFAEYEEGITGEALTAEEKARIITEVLEEINEVKKEGNSIQKFTNQLLEDYDRYITRIVGDLNYLFDIIQKRGAAYEQYLAKIGIIAPIDLFDTKLKETEEKVRDFTSVVNNFYKELARLRGNERKAFEIDLQQEIEEWREAKIAEKDIAERIALERRKFEEEQRQKEIEAAFKKEEEEWKLVEEARKREEEKLKIIQELHQKRWELFATDEEKLVKTLREEVKAYREAGASIEQIEQYVHKRIEDLVRQEKKEKINAIEEERDAQIKALEDMREARERMYSDIARAGMTDLQKAIADVYEQYQEFLEETGDPEGAKKWYDTHLGQIFDQEVEKRKQLQQKIIDSEENLKERIKELTMDEYEYKIHTLELQAEKYKEEGLSERTIAEWLYNEKLKIWEQEVEAFKEKERRKQEAQESAFYRYRQFILRAQGLEEQARIESAVRDIKDLIKGIWEAYSETPEKAKQMIQEIISNVPLYFQHEGITEGLQGFMEAQAELQKFFQQLQHPPKFNLPDELAKLKPVKPDLEELNDKVKDVTLSTQEWQQAIESVVSTLNAYKDLIDNWFAERTKEIEEEAKAAKEAIEKEIKETILDLFKQATQNILGAPSWYETGYASGKAYIKGFNEGVEEDAVQIAQTIARFIKFHSPPEEGPLSDSDEYGYRFIKMFIESMMRGIPYLVQSISYVFAPVSPEHIFYNFYDRLTRINHPWYLRHWGEFFKSGKTLEPILPGMSLEDMEKFLAEHPANIGALLSIYRSKGRKELQAARRMVTNIQNAMKLQQLTGEERSRFIEALLHQFGGLEVNEIMALSKKSADALQAMLKEWRTKEHQVGIGSYRRGLVLYGDEYETVETIQQFLRFIRSFDITKQGMTDKERHMLGLFTTEELLSKYVGTHGQNWTKAIRFLLKAKEVGKITEEEFKQWVGKVFEMLVARGNRLTISEQQWIDRLKQHPETWSQSYINQYLTNKKANFSPAMLAWMLSYFGEQGIKQNFPDLWEKLKTGQYGYSLFGRDVSAYWMAQIPWGQPYGQWSGGSGTSTSQYGTGSIPSEYVPQMGGAGIMINLIFNIDEVNDINIKDFAKMVSDELMSELSKYIV